MLTGAHLLISWITTVEWLHERRARTLVTLAGIAPDVDGLGIIADNMTGTTAFYLKYHHYVGHAALSALIIASLLPYQQKNSVYLCGCSPYWLSVCMCLLMLLDPKGQMDINGQFTYLYPFNAAYELTWSG